MKLPQIYNLGKQLACGYNTGQWTRVQITDIQMSPNAVSSSSTAKTPFLATHSWVGGALSWLFQSPSLSMSQGCGGEWGAPKAKCFTLQLPGSSSEHPVSREHEHALLFSCAVQSKVSCVASEPSPGTWLSSAITGAACTAPTKTLSYCSSISMIGT